jgi:chromosome segregation ATPase
MADFGKSLGNLALAATVSLAPMQSNAADVSKLPEAVIAKCRADAMRELAGLKEKIDAAAPTSSPELNAQRMERYTSRVKLSVDTCMKSEALDVRESQLDAQSAQLKARSAQLKARSAQLDAQSAQLDTQSTQLDVVIQGLQEMDRELIQHLAFFDDFMAGKKSRAEYNTQIASLPAFVQRASLIIADARKAYANRPDKLATYDRIEKNMRNVMTFAANIQQTSGPQSVSFVN